MVTHAAKSPTAVCEAYDNIGGVPILNKFTYPLPSKVRNYIEECISLCRPDNVYICDGSDGENSDLLKSLTKSGTIQALPKYDNW